VWETHKRGRKKKERGARKFSPPGRKGKMAVAAGKRLREGEKGGQSTTRRSLFKFPFLTPKKRRKIETGETTWKGKRRKKKSPTLSLFLEQRQVGRIEQTPLKGIYGEKGKGGKKLSRHPSPWWRRKEGKKGVRYSLGKLRYKEEKEEKRETR